MENNEAINNTIKEGTNPNKAQTPLTTLDSTIPHKRINFEEVRTSHMIAWKGKTQQRLFKYEKSIEEKVFKLPINDSRLQTSFKKCVASSIHVNGTILCNGEAQHDIEDLLNFKLVKGKLVRPATSIGQFLDK